MTDVLAEDIKDVYAEAKSSGFDVKILRRIIAMRKLEDPERQERKPSRITVHDSDAGCGLGRHLMDVTEYGGQFGW